MLTVCMCESKILEEGMVCTLCKRTGDYNNEKGE